VLNIVTAEMIAIHHGASSQVLTPCNDILSNAKPTKCTTSQTPRLLFHAPFEGFILFIVKGDRQEGMGEKGEDMQQKTNSRNVTPVAAVRTGP
jgi:hypothetical protein